MTNESIYGDGEVSPLHLSKTTARDQTLHPFISSSSSSSSSTSPSLVFSFPNPMGSCVSSLSSRLRSNSKSYGLPRFVSSGSWSWRKSRIDGRSGREKGGYTVDGMSEQELHCIPGRKFGNGASDRACLYTRQGMKGTNQDAMLLWEDFASRGDTVFCGVFDGHGPNGHLVARRVRDSLPIKLCNQWKAISSDVISPLPNGSMGESTNPEENDTSEWIEHLDVTGSCKLSDVFLTLRQSLLKTFRLMDKELKVCSLIDCFCSGSTAVTLVKQGQDLVIGNIGDSRAVLGTRDKENSLTAVQLTVDLKPNLPGEATRIQQCMGRIFALKDEPDVARMWLPNGVSPGLAMTRAFGDFCLKDYGLISDPDITYHQITDKDDFVVLATDGVWDVFSNKEVVDIIASAPTRATAARSLVDCAVQAWRLKFPESKIDDCAVVCLFLQPSQSMERDHKTGSQKTPREPIETTLSCTDKGASDAQVHNLASESFQPNNSTMEHLYVPVPGSVDEIVTVADDVGDEKLPERCQSTRIPADHLETTEDEEWTALEGVTRVNSLLNLPRFRSGDKQSVSRRKWLRKEA